MPTIPQLMFGRKLTSQIDELRLDASTFNALRRLGIKTVGQLLGLQIKDLSARSGIRTRRLSGLRKAVIDFLALDASIAEPPESWKSSAADWWFSNDSITNDSIESLNLAATILPDQNSRTYVSINKLDGLTVRTRNALRRAGYSTVSDILKAADRNLLQNEGFGKASLANLKAALLPFLEKHESVSMNAELLLTDTASLTADDWNIPDEIQVDLSAPITVLDLSTRPYRILVRIGIRTVEQLVAYPKSALPMEKNCGRRSVNEIATKLTNYLSGKLGESLVLTNSDGVAIAGIRALIDKMLSLLPERQRNVIADRYGLWDGITETLQDIGDKQGLTRERIRQIEGTGLRRLRRLYSHRVASDFISGLVAKRHASVPDDLRVLGENEAINMFAVDCSPEQAALALSFLQDLDDSGQNVLRRYLIEAEPDVYCLNQTIATQYKELLKLIELTLEHHQKPISERHLENYLTAHLGKPVSLEQASVLKRLLAISPSVLRLNNGTIGFSGWMGFKRRDTTSLAEAALRIMGRPAHFREVADQVTLLFRDAGSVNERTIHQALITDQHRFVWVKSGTYGLVAWGLKKPPFIKDRLTELLSTTRYPLPFWHLKEKVLEVCNCKEESVRMTLDLNPRVFRKFEKDQYGLVKHYESTTGGGGKAETS